MDDEIIIEIPEGEDSPPWWVRKLLKGQREIMATVADLQAAVDAQSAGLGTLTTDVEGYISSVTAGTVPQSALDAILSGIQANTGSAASTDAAVQAAAAALTPVPAPAPAPAPVEPAP